MEVLRHALPHEEQADDDGDRQQDVEGAAHQVGPEVADPLRRAAREAAHQGDRERDAGRRRDEIVDRQPRHLDEVAHGRLGYVGLPVGVGVEAHRRVEGEPFLDRRLPGRIEERQQRLETHQRIEAEEARQAEHQHRHGIGDPTLLALRIDAAQAVEQALEWAQHRRQKSTLAGEDARHVTAERLHEQDDDHAIERDLKPTVEGHRRCSSEAFGTQQRVDEITQQAERHCGAQDVFEQHGSLLQAVAGVGVGDGQREAGAAGGDQYDVVHQDAQTTRQIARAITRCTASTTPISKITSRGRGASCSG